MRGWDIFAWRAWVVTGGLSLLALRRSCALGGASEWARVESHARPQTVAGSGEATRVGPSLPSAEAGRNQTRVDAFMMGGLLIGRAPVLLPDGSTWATSAIEDRGFVRVSGRWNTSLALALALFAHSDRWIVGRLEPKA